MKRAALQILYLVVLFILPLFSFGQARYNFVYEGRIHMNSGAENIAAGYYLWGNLDNRYIPTTPFQQKTKLAQAGNFLYRMTKLFLVDYPINFVLPSLQHEQFGHGSRVLEFKGNIVKISAPLPPPFGFNLPFIRYNFNNVKTSRQSALMNFAGGSEANTVLGNILRRNIFLEGSLDYHQAFMYLYSNNDLTGYTLFAASLAGGDIQPYINGINDYYGSQIDFLNKLKTYSALAIIADPLNYLAFYSIFKNYLWSGKTKTKVPFISITPQIQFLPKFSFSLAPYGVELLYQGYFKYKKQLYAIQFGHNDGTFDNSSWRFGIDMSNVLSVKKFAFNASAQVWNQPEIKSFENEVEVSASGFGGFGLLTAYYDWIQRENLLGLSATLGYKSYGFVPGEVLSSSFIFRLGLAFRMNVKKYLLD